MADYICAELSSADTSALPGQSTMVGHGVICRRGQKQLFVLPYGGREMSSAVERADERCRNVMSADGSASKFLDYISSERSIGGYTSVSEQFKIIATGFDDLVAQLRERGFNVTYDFPGEV